MRISQNAVSLILAGFLALFLELALIRWWPANVLSLAYFSNLVLIASFVGLGIGFLLPQSSRDRFRFFPLVLLSVVGASIAMRFIQPVIPTLANESMWSLYVGNALEASRISVPILLTLAVVFLLNAAPFVLLGDRIARLMREFKPLTAYALDIAGSLLGIVAFTILSFLGQPFSSPVVWFAIAGVAALRFVRESRAWLAIGILSGGVLVASVGYATRSEIWSPYYTASILSRATGRMTRSKSW
jgi:hypothetical protein